MNIIHNFHHMMLTINAVIPLETAQAARTKTVQTNLQNNQCHPLLGEFHLLLFVLQPYHYLFYFFFVSNVCRCIGVSRIILISFCFLSVLFCAGVFRPSVISFCSLFCDGSVRLFSFFFVSVAYFFLHLLVEFLKIFFFQQLNFLIFLYYNRPIARIVFLFLNNLCFISLSFP